MSKVDPGTVVDGFGLISDGVNSQQPPQLLPRTQFAWALNMTFRNGTPTTRPGWVRRALKFTGQDGQEDPVLKFEFENAPYQGAAGFERVNQIVVSSAGRLYRIIPDTWDVLNVTPSITISEANETSYRCWFAEAEDFMVRQDGQSSPWIYDGAGTRPADSAGAGGVKEVPGGTAMCYSQGRLVVATADGRSFVCGDITGGPSGTSQYGFRDAVLKFTENDLISLGGAFAIPINAGEIRAIRPIAQVDTSLGQGPTQIFSQLGVFSLNTPSDRTTWKSVNYPIQTFSVVQAGAVSDRATVMVNGDIWFRALDGIRSFQVARRDFGSWTNAPQSAEMIRALALDDQNLLGWASGAVFDNRLLMTCRPTRVFGRGVVHAGLAVLDFQPVSTIGSQAKPIWEGIWTGTRILQVFSANFHGTPRCFMFALNPDDEIELWEMTRDGTYDTGSSGNIRIEGFAETSGYSFPDAGFSRKRLSKAWFWPEDIKGQVEVDFAWKANQGVNWTAWTTKAFCSSDSTCGLSACNTPTNLVPQYRRPYLLNRPTQACENSTQAPNDIGEYFQLRLGFIGHVRMSKLLLECQDTQEVVNQACPDAEDCRTAVTCYSEGFQDYSIYTGEPA